MIRRFYIMPLNRSATTEKVAEFIEVYNACDAFILGLHASAAVKGGTRRFYRAA